MASTSSSQGLFGVLNLHKPAGVTSREVVNTVQSLVRPNKVGHAGTLDPMATGVLLVCVGRATRLVSILQQPSKSYRARFRLGQYSDTDDSTGNIRNVLPLQVISQEKIEKTLQEFCGVIEQIPPVYSAVKVQGQRAYTLARQGSQVTLRARPVRIDSIELLNFHWPNITLDIQCGSGTYIRSIARDLGDRLGCGGLMTALERTRIGAFCLDDSVDVNRLTAANVIQNLLPAVQVTGHISQYRCSETEQEIVSRGGSFDLQKQRFQKQQLPADQHELTGHPSVALLSDCGTQLLALAEIRKQGRRIQPRTVFTPDTNRQTEP
ncbi:MAG: tRNA pseudouridine(55) synthase TruB [Fuerstiella sp.]|nr:tRNA pseudouridine(55) synthase TruB [Fuerstiella sp.]